MKIDKIALVFVGGAFGSICRHIVGLIVDSFHLSFAFIATFIVNLLGCFIIGFLVGKINLSQRLNLLLVTGFCGGFTTFSTFSKESLLLIENGQLPLALCYIISSIVLGTILVWHGYTLSSKKKNSVTT